MIILFVIGLCLLEPQKVWWTQSTRVQQTCTRSQEQGENSQIAQTDYQSTTVHHLTATDNGHGDDVEDFLGITSNLARSRKLEGLHQSGINPQPAQLARKLEFSPKIHIFDYFKLFLAANHRL